MKAYAAPYVLPNVADDPGTVGVDESFGVPEIGSAAADVADSIPGVLGDLLPVMIGLLVVTFVVRFVMRMIRQ